MQFQKRTLMQLGDLICGNFPAQDSVFVYRTGSRLSEFFEDVGTSYRHDRSTRRNWVADTLSEILAEPQSSPGTPPETFARVIDRLMDRTESVNDDEQRSRALAQLNKILLREGFEAFYAENGKCYLRHITTDTVATPGPNPHRPFSPTEIERRERLLDYLRICSEDELIEEILLPLFRQLGYHRITAAGHRDKALEYGTDIWMRYTLPSQHVLYFGIQAKKGKLDASGTSHATNTNIAEIYHQALMMLGHKVFDPEIGKQIAIAHAFIIASGEITKAARNWLGNSLDASKHCQILFMDRDDILNLFVATNLPLPIAARPEEPPAADDLPF